jgi:hypothetical protein
MALQRLLNQQKSRKLVAQGFAAASGHDHQTVATLHQPLHHLPLNAAEVIVTKESFEMLLKMDHKRMLNQQQ